MRRHWRERFEARSGRAAEPTVMRENLGNRRHTHVQVICGMGGIGKTELSRNAISARPQSACGDAASEMVQSYNLLIMPDPCFLPKNTETPEGVK